MPNAPKRYLLAVGQTLGDSYARTIATAGMCIAAAACATNVSAQGAFTGYQPAEWAKIVAAAKAEGKVILYAVPVPAALAAFKAGFEKAYPGIVVEPTRLVGTQLPAKIDQDRQSGVDGADVTIAAEVTWLAERASQGALKAPVGPATAAWPAKYVIGGVAPILALEPFVLTYNSNLVKTALTGYADLLRPEFKGGKLGMVEPNSGAMVAFYDWLEKAQGTDFLSKVAAQNPRLYVSALPVTQGNIAGEIALSSFSVPTVVSPQIAQGAPIKMVVPNPSVGVAYAGGVFSWAKRQNAALVFLDFMMSPAGQSVWAGKGEVGSPIGVPGSLDVRTINALDQSKYPPDVTNAYQAKWARIFKGQ